MLFEIVTSTPADPVLQRSPRMLEGWDGAVFLLSATAALTGTFYLLGLDPLRPIFVSTTYACLAGTLVRCARGPGGWAHPVCMILVTGLLRYTLPAWMLEFTDPPATPTRLLQLTPASWQRGHDIGLLGMAAFALGAMAYRCGSRPKASKPPPEAPAGLLPSALGGFLIGTVAVALFMAGNVNVLAALESGEFRSTTIQVGTGKYFLVGFMAISASFVLIAHLERLGRPWWLVLLPGLLNAAVFFPLGGRIRAVGPLVAAAWLLWLRRGRGRIKATTALPLGLAALLLLMFFQVGGAYRGGQGVDAFKELSVSSVQQYASHALWLDVGQLHSLAAASQFDGGELGGLTFVALLWPISQFFGLPEKSAGMFVIESLYVGQFSDTWGYHSGLIADAFINFGVVGIPVVMALFGVVMSQASDLHWRGRIHAYFYLALVFYSIRIFSESIDKYKELFSILAFITAIHIVAKYRIWKLARAGLPAQPREGLARRLPAPSPVRR